MSHERVDIGQDTEQAFRTERDELLAAGNLSAWRDSSLIFADWLEDRDRPNEAKEIRDRVAIDAPVELARWPNIDTADDLLTTHQAEQLRIATRRPFGILCGTPGTGKTHVAAVLAKNLPASRTAVVAPTGKAAVRITESLRSVNPGTRMVASTIHQLLGIDRAGYDGGGWTFSRDESNPLPHEFLILDEPSMLGTELAASLFRAIRPGTHLLAVGDPDQLPPVGHGAPLRDWINSGVVPVGRLTEIHRNGGAIAGACAAIRAGEQDKVLEFATPSTERDPVIAVHNSAENWRHIETPTPERTVETLQNLLQQFTGGGLPASVQILAPVREKGPLSCRAINQLCQNVLNPTDPTDPQEIKAWGERIRPGDRVVCLHNHNAATARNALATRYVANGEIGVVRSLAPHITGEFGSDVVRMSRADEGGFGLGYCLTVHKAQGSEWPITIVILDGWGGSMVMGREWIYTALSRARHMCITVGRLWSARRAVSERRLEVRRTFLDTQMREGVQGGA